jgi:hypothetical protein
VEGEVMIATFRAPFLAMVAAATIGLVSRPALAQPTPAEYLCASNAARTFGRFIPRKSKCVQRCITRARTSSQLYGDCFEPFGGSTATCITDPVRGAEARARASIVSRCTPTDCPPCFPPSACTSGEPFVSNVESQLDLFSYYLVYCVESTGTTPSPTEASCEDAVSRAVVKLGASRIRCYTRCFSGIFARSCPTCTTGQLPAGSCNPPVSDSGTAACIARAEATATAVIDASCSAVGGNPACYVANGLDTGAAWGSLFGGAIDGQVPNLTCGF